MIDPAELVVLDFETYYDSDYSLTKLNTSGYIRDPRFKIHGVGIKDGEKPTVYVYRGIEDALRSLELEKRPCLAHNTAFDGFILHTHFELHPRVYCDTLGMARATLGHHMAHDLDTIARTLGLPGKIEGLEATKGVRELDAAAQKRLGAYCVNDVDRCWDVFWVMYEYMPEDELKLVDLTLRMFCQPVLQVNEDRVHAFWEQERANKKLAIKQAGTMREVLASNDKFAELLRELGVEPPTKPSPSNPEKTIYAFAKTDPGFIDLCSHADEAVRFAAEARREVRSTINETRAKRLLDVGVDLPVLLNYAGAHTYRWSGGNKINLQNLPRGGELRRSILAPPGYVLLVHDQSQIEARLNAWFCRQDDVIEAFRAYDRKEGPSVYRIMASKVYRKDPAGITQAERHIGKVCVLGLGYGMGWRKLKLTLALGFGGPPIEISNMEAQRIVSTYRATNPHIVAMQQQLSQLLLRMTHEDCDVEIGPVRFGYKMVELPSGLALKYPGLRIIDGEWGPETEYFARYGRSRIYGGLLLENIIQALARCTIAENMLRIPYKIATMTHDEIVSVVPQYPQFDVARAWDKVRDLMLVPPAWAPDLPLNVNGGWDREYSK